MDKREWNVSEIVFGVLADQFKVRYSDMVKMIGCTDESLRNWRSGKTKPQKRHIDAICDGLPGLLKRDESRQEYLSIVKQEFLEAGDRVIASMERCRSMKNLLNYLYLEFEKDLGKDRLYGLINNPGEAFFLRDIIQKKLRIYMNQTQIFQMEEFGLAKKAEIRNGDTRWKFDPEHCLLLKFKGNEKKYDYEVLINFNFNDEEFWKAGDCLEARDMTKAYGVKMILLFSNTEIPKDKMRLFLDSNIYVEHIDAREIRDMTQSRDYVYSAGSDRELEMLANRYADVVLQQLDKYYSVVFKNVLFELRDRVLPQKAASFIFWDVRYAAKHHISFQTERILEFFEGRPEHGTALAIGYLSFPSILKLAPKFDRIYLMDNSPMSLQAYDRYLNQYARDIRDADKLRKKITFITFTSAMFDAVSEKYGLYGSVDFILLGTGSGSFIKRQQTYYRMCNLWLKENGVLYISFLNREFPYRYVDRFSAEQNLEFLPDIDNARAAAAISADKKYDMYCETMSSNEIRNMAEMYYRVERLYSYPLASVLEGAHKPSLQNILKELDKEYSRAGFTSQTFSNSLGYFVDALLVKQSGRLVCLKEPEAQEAERVNFDYSEDFRDRYLKVVLLAEKSVGESEAGDIYAVLMSARKRLPEPKLGEIHLEGKKFRLLSIAEINALGLEYRNISPFLIECDSRVKFTRRYDADLRTSGKDYYYVGDGSHNGGYKVRGSKIAELVKRYGFIGIRLE